MTFLSSQTGSRTRQRRPPGRAFPGDAANESAPRPVETSRHRSCDIHAAATPRSSRCHRWDGRWNAPFPPTPSERPCPDERDSAFEPGANKKLYRIDLDGASDVGPASTVANSNYDAAKGGLLVGGKNIEVIAGKKNTADTTAALVKAGITPVTSTLFLDYAGLVTVIEPTGGFFGHDKVEGVAVKNGGRDLYLSNDSDFGIDGLANPTQPYVLRAKKLPNGSVDSGEVLHVRMTEVPAQFKG